MPIRSMFFHGASGRDIHLVRGDPQHNTSRSIRDFGLSFVEIPATGQDKSILATKYFQDHKANIDVALEFVPTFKHTDVPANANRENFGIHVNRVTGTVLVDPGPIAPPFPSNFLIQINARHLNVTPAPAAVEPIFIRVHVHDGVDRIWITPKPLTIRRRTAANAETSAYRFTVRARFTDGAVGDITLYHGVTWTPAPKHFQPGPFTTLDAVDNAGLIRLPAGFQGPPPTVTATWQAAGGNHSDTAVFAVAPPWASEPVANLPAIELVSGAPAVWSGTGPERFPNVLLLGAGFASGKDTDAFVGAAARIASDLKTDFMTRPFDLLSDSMNLWRVASPAANPGVSVRGAVYLPLTHNGEFAFLIPPPRPHAGGTAPWTLENLIFAVGLPLPSYAVDLRKPEVGFLSGVTKFWAATAQAQAELLAGLDLISATRAIHLIDRWLDLGSARFIDEVDDFPAIAVGIPPNASITDRGDALDFHPDRGTPEPRVTTEGVPDGGDEIDGLQPYFAVLSSSGGVNVPGGKLGHLWSGVQPAFAFDNRNLITVIAAGPGGARRRPGRGIFVPIQRALLWHTTAVAAGQIRHAPLGPFTVPTPETFSEFSRLVAHELSHGFGLQDEYAELPLAFRGAESAFTGNSNVTSLAAVVSNGRVLASTIKWNWDRIRRAAVLTGPVTGSGSTFNIPVVAGQQLAFAQNEVVRLRLRTPRTPLARAVDTLVTFANFELTIVSNGTNPIRVTSATAKMSDLLPFKAGSLVFSPVRAVPANAGSPFLHLIAPTVAAHIDATGNPLTGPVSACNPAGEALVGNADQIPIIDRSILSVLFSFRNTPYIVGLYTGGATFGCGVFHPAGACMMRNHHPDVSIFCPVCKYALVDLIDPTKHRELEDDFSFIYPD